MLVLPEAAKLSIYYCEGKSVAMHLLKGPNYRRTTERLKGKKKSQQPVGIEPTISIVLLRRRVLNHDATIAAHLV